MAKLIGIDVGTTATKAILIDESGKVLKQASSSYPLAKPQPLWAEQDPLDWKQAAESCLEQLGEPKPDAIGLTGQMHGMVALDSDDQVVRSAILWCDQRTEAECEEINEKVGAENVIRITGNSPVTGFQLPKVLWLKNNEPDAFSRTKSVLLPKDYIRFVMTGDKASDKSDASGVGMLDLESGQWSSEMSEKLGIDISLFPKVFGSSEQTGVTKGFGNIEDGVPVVAGASDQAASAVGTGIVSPGLVSISLGTSGVVFAALDQLVAGSASSAQFFFHANGGFHTMGVMLACGGAVQWLKDTVYSNESFEMLDSEAAQVEPGCEGLTFLPYLSGERCPHIDANARGAFAGLTLSHGRGHLARAVIEGASFGLADCMTLVTDLGVDAQDVRVTGGGAKSDLWMQTLSDILKLPCKRIIGDEGPAMGAALLAGKGIGIWSDLSEACSQTVEIGKCFEPSGVDYSEAQSRYRKLYPTLKVW